MTRLRAQAFLSMHAAGSSDAESRAEAVARRLKLLPDRSGAVTEVLDILAGLDPGEIAEDTVELISDLIRILGYLRISDSAPLLSNVLRVIARNGSSIGAPFATQLGEVIASVLAGFRPTPRTSLYCRQLYSELRLSQVVRSTLLLAVIQQDPQDTEALIAEFYASVRNLNEPFSDRAFMREVIRAAGLQTFAHALNGLPTESSIALVCSSILRPPGRLLRVRSLQPNLPDFEPTNQSDASFEITEIATGKTAKYRPHKGPLRWRLIAALQDATAFDLPDAMQEAQHAG